MTVLQQSAEKRTREPTPPTPTPPAKPRKKPGPSMTPAKFSPREKAVTALIPAAARRPTDLPHRLIRSSPTNPRKTFNQAGLESLAESIKKVGLQQRIVVRPVAAKGQPEPRWDGQEEVWIGAEYFEIVAGERRWRACKIAGLDPVPVDSALLSDETVAAVQLVENDERADLRPSEQAAAYARLARSKTAEEIHAMTGRPVSVIRGILKLARLPDEVLAAVDEGRLPRITAELVARIPGDDARHKAAMCVLAGCHWYRAGSAAPKPGKDAEPLTSRQTKQLIAQEFQKELKSAPFDRLALDLVKEAGSCEACPKRAGNDEDAKADGVRADMCLDTACYRAKVEAHNRQALDQAKATGRKLLPKRDSVTLFNSWDNRLAYDAEYVDLDRECFEDPKRRLYRDLLKDVPADQVVVAVDHADAPRELVLKKVAAPILKTTHRIGGAGKCCSATDAKYKKEQAERDRKAKLGRAAGLLANGIVAQRVAAAFAPLAAASAAASAADLMRLIVGTMAGEVWTDACRHVVKRRGIPPGGDPKGAVEGYVATLATLPDLMGLLAELVAARKSQDWGSHWNSTAALSTAEAVWWDAWGVKRPEMIRLAEKGESPVVRALALAGVARGEPIGPLKLTPQDLNRAIAEEALKGQKGMTQDRPVRIPHVRINNGPFVVLYAEDHVEGTKRTGGRSWVVRPLWSSTVSSARGIAASHADPLEALRVEIRDTSAGAKGWHELVVGGKGEQRALVHTPPAKEAKA